MNINFFSFLNNIFWPCLPLPQFFPDPSSFPTHSTLCSFPLFKKKQKQKNQEKHKPKPKPTKQINPTKTIHTHTHTHITHRHTHTHTGTLIHKSTEKGKLVWVSICVLSELEAYCSKFFFGFNYFHWEIYCYLDEPVFVCDLGLLS